MEYSSTCAGQNVRYMVLVCTCGLCLQTVRQMDTLMHRLFHHTYSSTTQHTPGCKSHNHSTFHPAHTHKHTTGPAQSSTPTHLQILLKKPSRCALRIISPRSSRIARMNWNSQMDASGGSGVGRKARGYIYIYCMSGGQWYGDGAVAAMGGVCNCACSHGWCTCLCCKCLHVGQM